jgi:putative transcriptional regulator
MNMAKQRNQLAEDILEGLNNAIAHARGEPEPDTVEHVVMVPDVKAIRQALHMTQGEFARTYKIPIATLRGWEQGRRHPDATAAAYLWVIQGYPKQAQQALSTH